MTTVEMQSVPHPGLWLAQELTEFLPIFPHLTDDFIHRQNHFHHSNLLLVDIRINVILNFLIYDMVYSKSQRDSGQRTCKSRVAVSYGFSSKTGSFGLSAAENNNDILGAVLFGQFLDPLLIFKIHCACASSDETLGSAEYHFGTGSLDTFFNGRTWDAVAITEYYDFLVFKHGSDLKNRN